MLVYRCNVGQTLIDETSDWMFATPQVEETYEDLVIESDDVDDTWSGCINDYWSRKPEPTYYN